MHNKILDSASSNLTAGTNEDITEVRRQEALLKTGALQNAILNSANFSSIATDAKGVIQIFNVGAERMLGFDAADVINKITPADISDPQEVIARAHALSIELDTPITPGFEALVFKASRGIEDIYELTYIRKDGTRFPAVVSVTALRDDKNAIIGYLLIGTDNTARKQVEAEQQILDQRLREQQFYTRSLIESNIDAIMTTDPAGIISDVNKQMEALTGCTRDELIGAPFKDYFTDPERAEAGIRMVLRDKKVTDYELTARARNGKETVVSYNATTFYDRDRKLQGVFAAARDITDRKNAEAALLKAGALQRAIFNSANFSSIATDAKGVIQIFNVGAERMLGYAAADVMNKITPADISDPQEVIARAEALSAELDTPITPGFEALVYKASRGIEDIYELTYIRKDGSRFPAIVSVTALRDAQESIIGYLLIGTDNTARKQAEEALLKAGALQKAIFDSANFSSIATDAKGVIQIFNVGAERMLGYAAAEVMNKITPADISDPQEVIARAEALSVELATPITPGFEALVYKAARGIEDIYELTYIRKDGSRFPAVVSVTALRDAQNTIIGYLLIGTDNTARKQVLEARERMIQIEKLSSLGTMVGGVAHEINNPLMGVMNYVEYARDKAIDPKSIEVLGSALHEIDRIREIVQHMLVFVRTDGAHQVRCNVHDSVKQTAALLEGEFRKNAVQLQIDLPEDLPLVKCSAGSLQQVLVNLLLNARDAVAGQAEQRITIRGQHMDGKIILSVCDNGPGVKDDIRQKIFDPFFTTKPIGKGTGLGLAVSQQLVEEVGGSLSYDGKKEQDS
jgi:PAS domain S-box-containing protein